MARILIPLLTLFIGLQFIRPALKERPHQPLFQGAPVPSGVAAVFERACQDCHSDNTRWPWYARVAPFSLLVGNDVRKGREFLNISDWNRYSTGMKLGFLAGMGEAARNRKMPPPVYTLMHADARLTDGERTMIARWANGERKRLRASVAK